MQMQIAEIKLRAERRAGEILGDMEKAKASGANQHKGKEVSHRATSPPKLDDLGITRSDSSRWQRIAAIPEERFEAHLCEERANRGPSGRFAKGNSGGPGDPHAPKVARLRSALLNAVTEEGIEAIIKKLVQDARTGALYAARECYCTRWGARSVRPHRSGEDAGGAAMQPGGPSKLIDLALEPGS